MSTITRSWSAARRASDQRRLVQVERSQSLAAQAARWFDRVKEFRAATDEFMVLQTPTAADRGFHRAYLVQVIASGEDLFLLAQMQNIGSSSAESVPLEAIEAELELLHASLAGEHYLSPEKRDAILNEVFAHGPQSAA